MRAVTSILFLSVLVPLATLLGQVQPPIEPGTRIRVTASTSGFEKLVGRCVAISRDTLELEPEAGATLLQIPLYDVTKLEVPRKRPGGKGALIGGGIGLLAGVGVGILLDAQSVAPIVGGAGGAALGAIVGSGGKPAVVRSLIGLGIFAAVGAGLGFAADEEGNDLAREHAAAIGAAVFGATGLTIGALSSLAVNWEEVPLDRLRVSFTPRRDGRLALGLSVSF